MHPVQVHPVVGGEYHVNPPALDQSAEVEVHHDVDSQEYLPAFSLQPGLITKPGQIAQALQGRLSSMDSTTQMPRF